MTLYDLAARYQGEILELPGTQDHPLVQWWFMLCGMGPNTADEVPWCGAYLAGQAWTFRLPYPRSAAARAWLKVGVPVPYDAAIVGFDVIVLKRGVGVQPGPEVLKAPGHVGLYAGRDGDARVKILGGNQSNTVSIASFPVASILGVRRLA